MKIFCDIDDTLIYSSKCVVDMINKKFGTNKTTGDIKDWGYRSIYKNITNNDINFLYEQDELFEKVEFFPGAIEFLTKHEVDFCTLGTKINLEKKFKFLLERYPKGFSMTPVTGKDKSTVDMKDAVQIDDKASNLLKTNAKIKILFKNYNNYEWQRISANSGIYTANNWKEVEEIVNFLEGFDAC